MLSQLQFSLDDQNQVVTWGELRVGYQEVAEYNSEIRAIRNDVFAGTLPEYSIVRLMLNALDDTATAGWISFNYCKVYGDDGTNIVSYGSCIGAHIGEWAVNLEPTPFN